MFKCAYTQTTNISQVSEFTLSTVVEAIPVLYNGESVPPEERSGNRGRMLHNRIAIGLFIFFICLGAPAFSQSDSLALSSSSTTQGGSASLNLSLTSPAGQQPAGIQWTLTYPSSDIVSSSFLVSCPESSFRTISFLHP